MLGVAVFQNAHVLAVKHWFAASEAGYYGAASSLAGAISVLFVAVYTLSGPLLTDRHARGEALLMPTLRLCGYFVALAAGPTLLFATQANSIVAMVYGIAFRGAGVMLAALAGVPLLTYLSLIIGQALITVGDRNFGRIYLGFSIVQILSFVFAHDTIRSIILSLYLVQGTLLLLMLLSLPRLRKGALTC
jgi:O-antigen/teichoic acid export membrane protein